MTTQIGPPPMKGKPDTTLSLYRLLAPQVLANPYPLYDRLRTEAPVHWDPFLHAWVVTRYADVVTVLHDVTFSAHRTPTPDHRSSSTHRAHLGGARTAARRPGAPTHGTRAIGEVFPV